MSDPRAAQDSIRDQLVAAARREPDPSRTAQTHLRDALVAAGVREYGGAAAARRRRRRHRRTTGLVVVGLLGAAAAANATGLISVGEELPPLSDIPARPADGPAGGEIVLTADDPKSDLDWGVSIYTARDGSECMLAGQVRTGRLGLERDGVFRPYSERQPASCGDLKVLPQMIDQLVIESGTPRTLIFGRTRAPDTPVGFRLKRTGEERTVRSSRGGAFLFVYDGRLHPSELELLDP